MTAIHSIKDLVDALSKLDIPALDNDVYRAISQWRNREAFKNNLIVAVDSKSPAAVEYVRNSLCCVTPNAIAALEQAGFARPPVMALLDIGINEGPAFRRAITNALGKSPQAATAKQYMQRTLDLAVSALPQDLLASPPSEQQIPSSDNGDGNSQAQRNKAQPARGNSENDQPSNRRSATSGGREQHPDDAREAMYSDSSAFVDDGGPRQGGEFNARSHTIYAGKFAICFTESETKSKKEPTLMIDGATATQLPNGKRKIEWQDKISIQLSFEELHELLYVLAGTTNSAKFNAHGPQNDKGFEIEAQDGGYFAKVMAKGASVRAAKMSARAANVITWMILKQISKHTGMDELHIYQIATSFGKRLKAA